MVTGPAVGYNPAVRAVQVLVAVVPVRIALDLLVPLGLSDAGQLGSAGIAAVLAGLVAARWRIAATHPWRWPMAAFAVLVLLGAARASTAFDAARYGLHLLTPALWLLALHAWWDGRGLPAVWSAAAAVPIGLSLGALATGQPADHVLHGWPRLIGPYANLHTHASVMAVLAATFLLVAPLRRSWPDGVLAAGSAICVGATWVRTAWLWVAIAVVAAVLARRRVGAAAVLVLVGVAAVLGLTTLRERWSDLVALATLTPPPEGWGALGSWRGRIWTESFATWLAGDPLDVALGRGLGGQYGLHRHLDPHSEWLSLLYQLGPAGLLVWLGWMAQALVDLGRRAARSDAALVAFAVLAGAVATSAVSNDLLVRATPVLWTFGLAGIALRSTEGEPAAAGGTSATSRPRSG